MTDSISSRILAAGASLEQEVMIEPFSLGTLGTNELLFFFKPESFMLAPSNGLQQLLDLTFDRFRRFGVRVSGAMLFRGERLAELGIMDRHYGYINRLSRNASSLVTGEDLAGASAALGVPLEGTPVLGGHEVLTRFPRFDAASLNDLWATKKSVRLRGGFYVQLFDIADRRFLLVDAFHPAQLEHFTAPGRKTALLLLHSDSPWRALRWEMIGDGFPERANPESIRGSVHHRKESFGLASVTIANNFVHLSAGPFEGLFEIQNFIGASKALSFDIRHTTMARALSSLGLDDRHAARAATNPTALADNVEHTLFAATEDIDTPDAALMYRARFSD